MASFLKYNCTDPNQPDAAVASGATIILGGNWNPALTDPTSPTGPVNGQTTIWTGTGMTGIASTIAGSAVSAGGTLLVEQSFDSINWDIQQSYAITSTPSQGISQQVLAPYLRIAYTNTSGSSDDTIRIFVRVFGSGRNNQ